MDREAAEKRSTEWLRENYHHIWDDPNLHVMEKAGFLAAACNPTRCYLMTLSLSARIDAIKRAIILSGK